ncbi:MAG: hypothetical protein ACLR7Z_18610 [Bilophila wadsworthia]
MHDLHREDGKTPDVPEPAATRGDGLRCRPAGCACCPLLYSAASASSICRSSGLSPARPQLA